MAAENGPIATCKLIYFESKCEDEAYFFLIYFINHFWFKSIIKPILPSYNLLLFIYFYPMFLI